MESEPLVSAWTTPTVHGPPGTSRSLPANEHMARVRSTPESWAAFRRLAKAKKRTVGNYLGWLVSKELHRAERAEARRAQRLAERHEEVPAELWVPPWEE
jgi:hypothetical protein